MLNNYEQHNILYPRSTLQHFVYIVVENDPEPDSGPYNILDYGRTELLINSSIYLYTNSVHNLRENKLRSRGWPVRI